VVVVVVVAGAGGAGVGWELSKTPGYEGGARGAAAFGVRPFGLVHSMLVVKSL